jgi:esterase/lipase
MISNIFQYKYSFVIISSALVIKQIYYNYCIKKTFNRLEQLFPRQLLWEKELNIYSVAMPKFFTTYKKNKCVLLISGYKDIPYLWNEIIVYFEKNNIDYYIPRTHGNGRSFFQNSEPNDWIITYLEAIKILETQYENIDIIGFSTGCVIALYLTQFKYNCNIKNIILCAPFLLRTPNKLYDIIFDSYFSQFITPVINFFMPLRLKDTNSTYLTPRDTNFNDFAMNDYYELASCFEMDTNLLKFIKYRPKNIYVENILIVNSNDEYVIGDVNEQKNILESIYNKKIDIINIPTYNNIELPQKCAHVMFKEHPIIVKNIFDNIFPFIKN